MESFKDYLRVKQAAEVLGVSDSTVRNWSRAGKLPTYRHPLNNYRLFKREDLQDLVQGLRPQAGEPGGADGDE